MPIAEINEEKSIIDPTFHVPSMLCYTPSSYWILFQAAFFLDAFSACFPWISLFCFFVFVTLPTTFHYLMFFFIWLKQLGIGYYISASYCVSF